MEERIWIYSDDETNIRKTVLQKGTLGRKPSDGSICNVAVDSNSPTAETSEYLTKPSSEIIIGNGDYRLDKCIEMCVQTMNVKEESVFYISVENEPEICVKICVNSSSERPYVFQLSDEEKIQSSNLLKAQGIELFKDKRIDHAFYKFSKAVKLLILCDTFLDVEPSDSFPAKNLMIDLYNNLASCQLHYKNYPYVAELCSKSLNLSNNVKALYRRSLAFIEMKDYEKAELDLIDLLKVEPTNKACLEKLKLVRELDKHKKQEYSATIKRMFT